MANTLFLTPITTKATEPCNKILENKREKKTEKDCPSYCCPTTRRQRSLQTNHSVRQHKPVKLQHNKIKLPTNRERQKERWKNNGKQELGSRVCLTLTEVSLSDEISYSSAVEERIVFHGLTLYRSTALAHQGLIDFLSF